MNDTPSRRAFLRSLLLASTAATLRPIDIEAAESIPGGLHRSGPRRRIAIVGAGMAGLTAALELTRAGHDVLVLEAQARPGGRVRTLRAPFADGLYAEAGAARIPESHDLTLRHIRALDLELAPFKPSTGHDVIHVAGRNHASTDPRTPAALGLTSEEQRLGPGAALRHFAGSALELLGSPQDPTWPPEAALRFDEVDGTRLLTSLGASRPLVDFFDLGFGVLGDLSGLDVLIQLESLAAPKLRIVGGNDRLPRTMAARLGRRIRYGAPVRAIRTDRTGARIEVSGPGGSGVVAADRVVLAVPLPVLRDIRIDPPLSPRRSHAIRAAQYASVTRVYAQVGRRFWEDGGRSGFAVTDHPMEIFDSSFGQEAERGLLMAYLHGDVARTVDRMGEHDGVRATLQMMEDVFPRLRDEIQGTAFFSWQRDPWARGALVKWRPGDFRTLYPHVSGSEGRLHFAGEHTSPWHAWIQGAVHSGVRAALEIESA